MHLGTQGGALCVTTHRLVWLPLPGATRRACGLSLACVTQAVPKPRATFGSRTPRLLVTVHLDANGGVTAGAARRILRCMDTGAPGLRHCGHSHSAGTCTGAPHVCLQVRCRLPASLVAESHPMRCRGESPEELVQALQQVLARRAWAQPEQPVASSSSSPQHGGGRTPPEGTTGSQLRAQDVGVAGILRRQEAAQQSRGRSMEEAFTDLAALMDKAKDMLAFAERIRDAMLRDSQSASADAASTEELEVRLGSQRQVHAWFSHMLLLAVVHAEPGHHEPGHTQGGWRPVPPAAGSAGESRFAWTLRCHERRTADCADVITAGGLPGAPC